MQCNDGTFCNVKSDSKGFKCCKDRQGRAKCPKNKPMMCENKRCDGKTDHCCSDKGCGGKYGGPRKCNVKKDEEEPDQTGMFETYLVFNRIVSLKIELLSNR